MPPAATVPHNRAVSDLDDIPPARLPDGYRVRSLGPGELAPRAAVHRRAWRPRRIGEMQVSPADFGDGWLDEVNRVALREPVGTDPAHARRGRGAAVRLACLHAVRDDAYPMPRALYHHIGFRDAARTVTDQREAQ
jgi:hypothetical protein